MANSTLYAMCYRCYPCGRVPGNARKSTVGSCIMFDRFFVLNFFSWLVDVSKDAEGLRIIVDLHGGDEANEQAQAEYQEIKDRVMFEVTMFFR